MTKEERALKRLDMRIRTVEGRLSQMTEAHPLLNLFREELSDWRTLRRMVEEKKKLRN